MSFKDLVKARAQQEKDMGKVIKDINNNLPKEIGCFKSNYGEVKFFEKDHADFGGGIGVRLEVILYHEKEVLIFSGVVRGSGRGGDDLKYWYRECLNIQKYFDILAGKEKFSVTLSSGLLEDTYEIQDGCVALVESIDLEARENEARAQKLLQEASEKKGKEKMDKIAAAFAEKLKVSGTRDPKVYHLDLFGDTAVCIVGVYRSGYDPAMKKLFVLVNEGVYEINLGKYYNYNSTPKFSESYFQKKNITITEKEIVISGEIITNKRNGIYSSNDKMAVIEERIIVH